MSAAEIAADVEAAISEGRVAPETRLPTVRGLAKELDVSPATVAAAYRTLRNRGLVKGDGRRGTVVAAQPPLRVGRSPSLPANARDLASGNPDPALLPPLEPALERVDPAHKLYGGPSKLERLVALAEADFSADGIEGDVAVVGGALDGIERILQTHLRPGDAVVVEDPSWPRIADLVSALSFRLEPAEVDEQGLVPDALEAALRRGAKALVVTPRGQNPTGAAVDAERARLLREVLAQQDDVLVIEDDYVAAVAGAPYHALHSESRRWAVVRSLSKVLGPDLRIALVTGDPLTISRVEGRQLLGPGWVSHLLQQTAANLLGSAATRRHLSRVRRVYAERRAALVEALAHRSIPARGESGLGVWVPVAEEAATAQLLLERGWAVSPGERYRFATPPGIRITTTGLEPPEAEQLAAAFAEIRTASATTYAG
ncbi:MAG TPA: aminotransferase class I/II-fold pyridoxal phosphate-dependent enzyme [Gaiellaceae bacterium]